MSEKPFLYPGLDHNERRANLYLAQSLSTEESLREQPNMGFKVNLDHAILWGTDYIREVQEFGRPVFVDLKMNNGARTMSHVVEELVDMKVKYVNIWSLADHLMKPAAKITRGSETQLLAMTVYTHYDDEYCMKIFNKSLKETVRMFAEMGLENGADGIILPGTTLDMVTDLNCPKIVPASRPLWFPNRGANDQEQTVTPTEAVKGGATVIVCGSPIHGSDNPPAASLRVYNEMMKAA